MRIESGRFGHVEVDDSQIIHFDEGILGFPDSNRYILVPHEAESPFVWLQSVSQSNLAFLLINPTVVKPEYVVQLPDRVAKSLKLQKSSDGLVLAIVVVPEDPREMRMNLRAPVVINTKERLGRQVVLEDMSLDLRCRVIPKDDGQAR